MSLETLAAPIATTLAVSVLYAALVWILQLGRRRAGVAYISPFALGWSMLLAILLLVAAAFNVSLRVAPQWLSLAAVGVAIALAFATFHWLRLRIMWDDDGFQVRGLLGGFAASWRQVKAVRVIENWTIKLTLDHPTHRRFQVSTFLVGARAFAEFSKAEVERQLASAC